MCVFVSKGAAGAGQDRQKYDCLSMTTYLFLPLFQRGCLFLVLLLYMQYGRCTASRRSAWAHVTSMPCTWRRVF